MATFFTVVLFVVGLFGFLFSDFELEMSRWCYVMGAAVVCLPFTFIFDVYVYITFLVR